MNIYNYIATNYKPLEPIEFSTLLECGILKSTICMQLKNLLKNNKICKYSRGIYYIPKRNETLGLNLTLSNEDVIKLKYISNASEVYGFYSEDILLNKYKFTIQVPNVITIVTNKETNIKRIININDYEYILKKSRTIIDKDNYKEMQFLEFINYLDKNDFEMDKTEKFYRLKNFIKKENIDINKCKNLIEFYPAKTAKRLMEVESAITRGPK